MEATADTQSQALGRQISGNFWKKVKKNREYERVQRQHKKMAKNQVTRAKRGLQRLNQQSTCMGLT